MISTLYVSYHVVLIPKNKLRQLSRFGRGKYGAVTFLFEHMTGALASGHTLKLVGQARESGTNAGDDLHSASIFPLYKLTDSSTVTCYKIM